MDWTPWIGRPRPVEEDALRILTVVHQLGTPARGHGWRTHVAGERRLLLLDHLVRHPLDLACVLIAAFDDRRAGPRSAALPREIRRLVAEARGGERPAAEHLGPFEGAGWWRWDDVCAFLVCRRLLEVRPGEGGSGPVYGLTDDGARRLEGLYASVAHLELYRGRCRALRRHLLGELGEAGSRALDGALREAGRRLELFRLEEQPPEEDLLSLFFHRAFGESL